MILTVFRPKRIKNGKIRIGRSYRGRYRLDGEEKITDIPLHTTDGRVAQQRIEQIVKEKQMEAVGLLAPHATRAAQRSSTFLAGMSSSSCRSFPGTASSQLPMSTAQARFHPGRSAAKAKGL